MTTSGAALETAHSARRVLGAIGITAEYDVMRLVMNLESVFIYVGSNEIHTLISGHAITGVPRSGDPHEEE